jgi:hypothetical protein
MLDIDDDVIVALRAIAQRMGSSMGSAASVLLRRAVLAGEDSPERHVGGFCPFANRAVTVTNELIDMLGVTVSPDACAD